MILEKCCQQMQRFFYNNTDVCPYITHLIMSIQYINKSRRRQEFINIIYRNAIVLIKQLLINFNLKLRKILNGMQIKNKP